MKRYLRNLLGVFALMAVVLFSVVGITKPAAAASPPGPTYGLVLGVQWHDADRCGVVACHGRDGPSRRIAKYFNCEMKTSAVA